MGQLLLGAPPPRSSSIRCRGTPPGQTFPGGEIYLSFPGLGDRLAAQGGPRALGNRLARGGSDIA